MKTINTLRLKLTTPKQKKIYWRCLDRPDLEELARLLEWEGSLQQTEELLRFALVRFTGNHLVWEQLAALYGTMGRLARAVEIYRSLNKGKES